MKEVHAPYNFVPVAETVIRGWGLDRSDRLPSQDAPYEDGICGEIELTLIAETPLLVAGEQAKPQGKDAPSVKQFARDTKNTPEIPGSSLKGMVRAVLEIASFSAMKNIEDRRFGLRDLSGPSADSYRRKFMHHGDGDGKSRGGWLRRAPDGTGWVIEPCRVERYAHDRFEGKFANLFRSLQREKKIEDKQAPQIYAAWKEAYGGDWMKALKTSGGELVFTGIPSPKKRKEFLFIETGETPIPVPDEVWKGFVDVHERQEKPSDTWMWWKKRLGQARWTNDDEKEGLNCASVNRIPVFYLHDGAQVISLGLAQMFKMSGSVSTREALPEQHRENDDDPDLAERIFGRVDEYGAQSFRGRVAFSAGEMENDDYDELEETTVASAPKPGFHPAYVRQHEPGAGRRSYLTWADDNAQLRGWKRYPAQERKDYAAPLPKDASKRSMSLLKPIIAKPGKGPLRFSTKLRFHNLQKHELGALLWALDFGGDAAARHALGMGKPFGWGRVRFGIGSARLAANGGSVPTLDACRDAFVAQMKSRLTTWETSLQIKALLAMARPGGELHYMTLDPKGRRNDFQDARNAGAILPGPGGITDWLTAPRGGQHAQPAALRPAPTPFREGDQVRDIEQGDFGVVVEDQEGIGADVLVDFDGIEDWMPAKALERV